MYMREEWDDENKSIVVYDKDSMRLWQNGELQITLKIPFRPARYEAIFDLISTVLKKDGGIMNGLKQNMDGIFENNAISKKQIGDIGFVKLSEDGKKKFLMTLLPILTHSKIKLVVSTMDILQVCQRENI